MKRKPFLMVSSICLIVAAAILASVAGLRQDGTWEQPSSQSTDITSTERDPEGTLSLRIASLPQPADIDAGDASAAESAYRQIADIYDLVQTYELTLTPEQESAISQVIAAYYPAEEIAGMKSLPAGGGVIHLAGAYQRDLLGVPAAFSAGGGDPLTDLLNICLNGHRTSLSFFMKQLFRHTDPVRQR